MNESYSREERRESERGLEGTGDQIVHKEKEERAMDSELRQKGRLQLRRLCSPFEPAMRNCLE